MTAMAGSSARPALRVRNLAMHYPLPDGSLRQALSALSFDVEPGEFVAVIGQSGCGKTTLLRLLMGLADPSAGSIEVFGRPAHGRDRRCAMVFQHAELLPWRTARSNVSFGLEVAGMAAAERRRQADRMLERVGLRDAGDLRPHQLSGGMRQRVGLARALATNPDILLMDEPFGALDACTRGDLQVDLNRLHEESGKTVIFVTHDVDEASALADRILVLAPSGTLASSIETQLPRPRGDLERLRSTAAFADIRFKTAQMLRPAATATRN
ncbi:MAG: ABC transporter ATP-binding protein [Reyranellaceae bacterium]